MHHRKALLATLLLLPLACGDDDAAGSDAAPADAALPDAFAGCDPTVALPYDWRPIDSVSTGAVAEQAGPPRVLAVDASAGGINGYDSRPFAYVKLSGGAASKVEITDVASYSSTEWHLAFKRYLVRVNGGDSGPGGVKLAEISAASLDTVTAAPEAGLFETDDWADADCVLVPGQLGEPAVAADWWIMPSGGMQIEARPVVYVLDLGGGSFVKLKVLSYYGDPSSPAPSGNYRIEWAPL